MNSKLKRVLLIITIPTLYALLLRVAFDLNIFRDFMQVMSLTFFLSVPFGVGLLTIALSNIQKVKSLKYRIFTPWLPIFIFFILTLMLSIEGWACWIMILPFFLIFASLGGITAGYFKLKKYKQANRLNISMAFLLPCMLSPLEKLLPLLPAKYEAYTFIDIHSSKEKIWENVLRVKEIDANNNHGTLTNFLGFPRPIKAELNYDGVGASRKAIFSRGLIFDETVLEYEDKKRMHFSITANPYDIPSTTMDKHVVIGGDYFNVLNGTYDLQQLNDSTYRLNLYSHFELKTDFNFYASWWAEWIMKDIQNNILKVIKSRCE
jgi:hypothetical protein